MARRDKGLLYDLAFVPWWISVCFGVVCYVCLKFILPGILLKNPISKGLAQMLPQIAWISGIFVIPAVASLFNSIRKSRQLERQNSIDSIRTLSWKQFEELVAEAYRRKGFGVLENATMGSDGGIDLRLERNGTRLLVQCKQWRSVKVSVNIVREMYGVMMHEKADGVVIVTSGVFTQEAREFAADKPIELIEGQKLFEMISGVQSQPSARMMPAKEAMAKQCPRCGKPLALREARRGSNAGSKFWGCSGYPSCRHSEPFAG